MGSAGDAGAAARIVGFVELLEGMKVQTRSAWASNGRHESVAEHSWRLAMLAIAAAPLQEEAAGKETAERAAVETVAKRLGGAAAERIRLLWEEYNAGETPAARAAKALDKIETIIQHNQGDNPDGFDYEYNLSYGASLARDERILVELRRLVDEATRDRANN